MYGMVHMFKCHCCSRSFKFSSFSYLLHPGIENGCQSGKALRDARTTLEFLHSPLRVRKPESGKQVSSRG
jgi:hypothetical protein